MNTCCLVLVVLIIVVILAAYVQRQWIMRLWGSRPAYVAAPMLGGDEDDYANENDIYGNEDFFGGGPFRLRVSDPEYTAILEGKKTVEARPDRPPFTRVKTGDVITVIRARPKGDTSEYPGGRYKHDSAVVRITKYPSLDALLKAEGVAKVYPGKNAAEAAARFAMYLPAGITAADPVIALELKAAKAGAKK